MALKLVGWLGWAAVAALWLVILRVTRTSPPHEVMSDAKSAATTDPEDRSDVFKDLRERYARGEIAPEEYPEELVRVPGAIGLYNPFDGQQMRHDER
jgi:uncharacterized membrane protein